MLRNYSPSIHNGRHVNRQIMLTAYTDVQTVNCQTRLNRENVYLITVLHTPTNCYCHLSCDLAQAKHRRGELQNRKNQQKIYMLFLN